VKINDFTERIIGAAIEGHRALGPGLLESAYESCLCHELDSRGLRVERQIALPVVYKGLEWDCGYRMDMLVENEVVVEIKAIEEIQPIHDAQLLTYLKLSGKPAGLIVHFNVPVLKQGIRRLVNNLREDAAISAPLR
jgi:GxxExxY protein